MADLFFLIVVAVIAFGLLILKTDAAIVLLALCSGSVLVEFANKNMAYVNGNLNKGLLPHHFTISGSGLEVAILLAPAVIVAILMRGNHGISRWPIQIFPAVATGILGLLLVVPLLSASMQNSITKNHYWSFIEQNQIAAVFICILVAVIVVVFDGLTHHKSKHH